VELITTSAISNRQRENWPKQHNPKSKNTGTVTTRRLIMIAHAMVVSILSTLSHTTLAIRPRRLNDPSWSSSVSNSSISNTIVVTCNDIERIQLDTIDIDEIHRTNHWCYNETVRQHCPESCPPEVWNALARWRKYEPIPLTENDVTMPRQGTSIVKSIMQFKPI